MRVMFVSCLFVALSLVDGLRLLDREIHGKSGAVSLASRQKQRDDPTEVADDPTEVQEEHPVHVFDWAKVTTAQCLGAALLLFIFGILVSAAGVGGGGLYLAALMLAGGLTAHDAVPMSHFIVLLGATGSLLVNARGWRAKGKCDIDVDVCRLVVPAALLGSVLGFLLNTRVSDALVMKGLALILTVLIGVTLRIWWQQRQEELGNVDPNEATGETGVPIAGAQQAANDAILDPKKANGRSLAITPYEILFAVLLLLVVDICSVVRFHLVSCGDDMKKGESFDWYPVSCTHTVLLTTFGEEVEKWMNSTTFMLMLGLAPLKACGSASGYYSWYLYSNANWKVSNLVAVTTMAFGTGVLSGLIGIGGGLIFSPFFLMTMDPIQAVGTSATCLLFIAASATLCYALTDRIIMSLAVAYGLVCFAASILGTTLTHQIRHHLPQGKSCVTLMVAFVVILTNCLTLTKIAVPAILQIMG